MTLLMSEFSLRLVKPGLRYGPTPGKETHGSSVFLIDQLYRQVLRAVSDQVIPPPKAQKHTLKIRRQIRHLSQLGDDERERERLTLCKSVQKSGLNNYWVESALAYTAVALKRTLGLDPRPNQLLAATLLIRGKCVEMATGEGKTVSLALASGVVAMCGTPIHVLTANDYLAQRDATYLEPYFADLKHTCGFITASSTINERRMIYARDIVYVTGQQVAFDWLKDELSTGRTGNALSRRLNVLTNPNSQTTQEPVMRGLCMAFVDEADSLFIDEADIPIVLASETTEDHTRNADAVIALSLAEQMLEGVHFNLEKSLRKVSLTDSGSRELEELSRQFKNAWSSGAYREERVKQALVVLHLYHRDVDYLVRDGRLQLLDINTGRVSTDRKLSFGLHRMLELKEKCLPSRDYEVVASIPVQFFFRRYHALVGASGTLREVRDEIQAVYGLGTCCIESHKPCLREQGRTRIFQNTADQLQALIEALRVTSDKGRPVLIGTRSVDQSQAVSAMLHAHSMPHQVLNAYQDEYEAGIIEKAGEYGQITVATNMAGRGTDIPIGSVVNDIGGLHVISIALQDSARLDRQLAGRAGRQGNRGSYERLYSLEDPFLKKHMPGTWQRLSRVSLSFGFDWIVMQLIRCSQHRLERERSKQRMRLYQSTTTLQQALSFSGTKEYLA